MIEEYYLPENWELRTSVETNKQRTMDLEEDRGMHQKQKIVNSETGAEIRSSFGWHPSVYEARVTYKDSEGRLFSFGETDGDEQPLSEDWIDGFVLRLILWKDGNTTDYANATEQDLLKIQEGPEDEFSEGALKAEELLKDDDEWGASDKPISEGGLPQAQDWEVREPTPEEWAQLIELRMEEAGFNQSEAIFEFEQSYTFVLDKFVSGSPGYVGPVYISIHAYPNMMEVRVKDKDGGLRTVDIEQ